MSETSEGVEEALEALEQLRGMVRDDAELLADPEGYEETVCDALCDLRERLEEVEGRLSGCESTLNRTRDALQVPEGRAISRYADRLRRRADRLEEALEKMTDPPLVLRGDDARDVASWFVERARSALDSAKDEGGDCTCPRYGSQHGWDPTCPRHAAARSEWCDYEDHVPGQRDYGFTDRGGRKRLCAKCEAPLEIHEDDGGKYTEGWHGEKTDQHPVHADEPEGDESDYGDGFVDGVAWAADQYDERAPFSWDDAVKASYEKSFVCERCGDSTSKERWKGGPVLCRGCRPTDEPVSREGEIECHEQDCDEYGRLVNRVHILEQENREMAAKLGLHPEKHTLGQIRNISVLDPPTHADARSGDVDREKQIRERVIAIRDHLPEALADRLALTELRLIVETHNIVRRLATPDTPTEDPDDC